MHYITKCSCGAVIAQCRCADPSKVVTVRKDACETCQRRGTPMAPDFCKALTDEAFRITAGLAQARSDEALATREREKARATIRVLATEAERLNPVLAAASIEPVVLSKEERSHQPAAGVPEATAENRPN